MKRTLEKANNDRMQLWNHVCMTIFIIYSCMYERMLDCQSVYVLLGVHMETFNLLLTLYTNVCEWNMWSRLRYLKCSTIFTDLGCASVARAEVRLSSSSDLYASTVLHLQGPRLNLFFLMACNCSVDVYFLISSNITGGLVIKHGRVEEKVWVGWEETREKLRWSRMEGKRGNKDSRGWGKGGW